MTHKTVVYKYGTGNPVEPNGSVDVRDGIDNLQSFDVFMNAEEDTYNQRDGSVVQTAIGAVRSLGFKPGSGDFTTGFTVQPGQRDYAWYDPVSKEWYSYLGVIPISGYVVTPATNPVGDQDWRVTSEHLFTQEGAGAVTRPSQDKMREIVSVKDFGAVGDGVTNDTASINSALAYASNRSLYFPAGVYSTNGGHSIPDGCCIYGDGKSSVLKSTSLMDGGVEAGFRLFDARNITGFIVRDLMMDLGGITVFPSAIRCMRIFNCSDYAVHDIKAITPGAFTASMQCHHYRVQDCDIKVQSTDGAAHHDGIIDQWDGSHDFQIIDNTIDGGGIALYPILVTGTDSNNNPTSSYKFAISGNIVSNTNEVGLWVQGRSGTCFDFDVSGNIIDTVTDFYGIAVTDSHDFTCRGNHAKNTGRNGLRFSTEGSGTLSAINGVIDGNIVTNANTVLSTNAGDGSAISVVGSCSRLSLTGNIVNSTTHTYAIFLGSSTSDIEVLGVNVSRGTVGVFFNSSASNRIPGGGTYTPSLTMVANVSSATPRSCKWERSGDTVRVTGRIEITPTVGASTPTQLWISLPVASNLRDVTRDLTGSATSSSNVSAAIFSDTANDVANFQFTAVNNVTNVFYFNLIYSVIP